MNINVTLSLLIVSLLMLSCAKNNSDSKIVESVSSGCMNLAPEDLFPQINSYSLDCPESSGGSITEKELSKWIEGKTFSVIEAKSIFVDEIDTKYVGSMLIELHDGKYRFLSSLIPKGNKWLSSESKSLHDVNFVQYSKGSYALINGELIFSSPEWSSCTEKTNSSKLIFMRLQKKVSGEVQWAATPRGSLSDWLGKGALLFDMNEAKGSDVFSLTDLESSGLQFISNQSKSKRYIMLGCMGEEFSTFKAEPSLAEKKETGEFLKTKEAEELGLPPQEVNDSSLRSF